MLANAHASDAWSRLGLKLLHLEPEGSPQQRACFVPHLNCNLATGGFWQGVPGGVSQTPRCFVASGFDTVQLKPLLIGQKAISVAMIEVVTRHSVCPVVRIMNLADAGRLLRFTQQRRNYREQT
jgi:hypothetical protein